MEVTKAAKSIWSIVKDVCLYVEQMGISSCVYERVHTHIYNVIIYKISVNVQ
jgi:hypothetical protein